MFNQKIKNFGIVLIDICLNKILGWYANEDEISKEIKEIHNAIVGGITTYTLKYNVKTKKRLTGIKIVEE